MFAQQDSLVVDKKSKNRYVIWLTPSASANIYGIAIGPIGSEAICNRPYTKYSHGLNVQILGQGILQTFNIWKFNFKDLHVSESSGFLNDSIYKRAVHNGLLVSPFGTFTDQVNGISISLWMSMGKRVNGLSFNLLWSLYEQTRGISVALVNHSAETKGVQIGIVNKTKKLRGFQFGLWNKNEKRSLPFINWNFK
jgi:hypothetical protein